MTQSGDEHQTLPALIARHPWRRWARLIACVAVCLGLIAGGAAATVYYLANSGAFTTKDVSASQALKIEHLESQLGKLGEDTGKLAARLNDAEQKQTAAANAASDQPDIDYGQLKNEVATLSASLNALQKKLNDTASAADQSRDTTQASLASVVAFTQLRAVADAGESFAPELQTMRRTVSDDKTLLDALVPLDPFAADGVATLPMLQEEFAARRSDAETAARRAGAVTWQDRVKVEFGSLITIHPLHASGEGADGFARIAQALADHHLAKALAEAAALPESSQKILADWRRHAIARQQLDQALAALAVQLTARPGTTPPAAPEEP